MRIQQAAQIIGSLGGRPKIHKQIQNFYRGGGLVGYTDSSGNFYTDNSGNIYTP